MSDAPDEVTITYPFSAEEHFRAITEQPARLWIVRGLWVIAASPFVLLLGRLLHDLIVGNVSTQQAFLGTLLVCLLSGPLALAPLLMSRFMISRHRRHTPDGTLVGRRFSVHGFAPSIDSQLIPWGLVTSVTETPNAFLITDASSTSYVSLPKRALSLEHLNRLRLILKKEFQARPKDSNLSRPDDGDLGRDHRGTCVFDQFSTRRRSNAPVKCG